MKGLSFLLDRRHFCFIYLTQKEQLCITETALVMMKSANSVDGSSCLWWRCMTKLRLCPRLLQPCLSAWVSALWFSEDNNLTCFSHSFGREAFNFLTDVTHCSSAGLKALKFLQRVQKKKESCIALMSISSCVSKASMAQKWGKPRSKVFKLISLRASVMQTGANQPANSTDTHVQRPGFFYSTFPSNYAHEIAQVRYRNTGGWSTWRWKDIMIQKHTETDTGKSMRM